MIIVSVENPFNGTEEERFTNLRYLSWCVKDCLDRGEAPVAGHGLCTAAYPEDSEHRAAGLAVCAEYRRRADIIALYVDRGISSGMKQALAGQDAMHKCVERRLSPYSLARFEVGEWPPGATVRLIPTGIWQGLGEEKIAMISMVEKTLGACAAWKQAYIQADKDFSGAVEAALLAGSSFLHPEGSPE